MIVPPQLPRKDTFDRGFGQFRHRQNSITFEDLIRSSCVGKLAKKILLNGTMYGLAKIEVLISLRTDPVFPPRIEPPFVYGTAVMPWSRFWFPTFVAGLICGAVFEAEAFVSCFKDMAVVGVSVEQRGGHFGIAEDGSPFQKAQEMEQRSAPGRA